MATPKDTLSKALEQSSNTSDQRTPWQEALDRHVTVPASRSVEAAEVFKGFAGSWAASYSLDISTVTSTQGAKGTPTVQKKTSHLGQAGMPEINFRPYDWGTHRFADKGPSLLGHPISFEVVGPTLKSWQCDWQWVFTENSSGDTLTIDEDGGVDLSTKTEANVGPALPTAVQTLLGGQPTLEDYYGFSSISEFVDTGLYIVISSGGGERVLDGAAKPGGIGDGTIGGFNWNLREGVRARTESSYTEIFRVVGINSQTRTITLDSQKKVSDYFDVGARVPIIRAITFIRPVATRLVAVPGSDSKVFAVVPPERASLDDTNPPYALWKATGGDAGSWNPWGSSTGGFHTADSEDGYFFFKPLLPIETPREQIECIQGDAFNSLYAPLALAVPKIAIFAHSGHTPDVNDGGERILRINEVELVGNATTFDAAFPNFPKDPGLNWWLGYHEITGVEQTTLKLGRLPEYNLTTGVPFYPQPLMDAAQYAPDPNDGIRLKTTMHEAVRTLWTDPHARMDKISAARLTNLINPSWVNDSQSLKTAAGYHTSAQARTTDPLPKARPDKAVFDTSTSKAGMSGYNADPGNLMDLGFRMVLFPAKDGGAGHLVPDFDNPVSSRDVLINPEYSDEEQWVDVDYSAGLVTLSHAPGERSGDLTKNGRAIGLTVLGPLTAGLNFDEDPVSLVPFIERLDGGSFINDGYKEGQKVTVTDPMNVAPEGTYKIKHVTTSQLQFVNSAVPGAPFTAGWGAGAALGNTSAFLTSGDNPRNEVVLFASCVPYTREPSQYGASIRVTAGQIRTGEACLGTTEYETLADVYGTRQFWAVDGSNATPQVVTSSASLSDGGLNQIQLGVVPSPVDLPMQGYIEVIKGTTPDGEAALTDGTGQDARSVATFGYVRKNYTSGILYVWGGGEHATQSFTVNDDNPHIVVLRRDITLPQWGDGSVGTDYRHDVTYGFASRSSTLSFRHAALSKAMDGSLIIENSEGLAETHQELFNDILSSWVLSGFGLTHAGGFIINVDTGAVVIDGVRSEMEPTSVELPPTDGHYYIYIKPHGGNPACPVCAFQTGLPLTDPSHVLVGRVFIDSGSVVEVANLQAPMQDINLRDEILVGNPSLGQNQFATFAQPHFSTLKDAVDYACELLQPRQSNAGPLGERRLRIKVVGPTYETETIKFTASGITIEGLGQDRTDGMYAAGTGSYHSIGWAHEGPLFDLNDQSFITFKNLSLEFIGNTKGGFTPTLGEGLDRVCFTNEAGTAVGYITIDNVLARGLNYNANQYNHIIQSFVYLDKGSVVGLKVKNCIAGVSDAAIYIGANDFKNTAAVAAVEVVIEDNYFSGTWDYTDLTANYRNINNLHTVHLKGVRGEAALPTLSNVPEPFGGIVICSVVNAGVRIKGNTIGNFAGYGIFSNSLIRSEIVGNSIGGTGDMGISLGCPWAYTTVGAVVASVVVRDNTLTNCSSLDLGGVDGRRFQYDTAQLVGVAGHPGTPMQEKRLIYLESFANNIGSVWNTITSNAGSIYNGNPTQDALVYFYNIHNSSITNNISADVDINAGGGGIFLMDQCPLTVVSGNICPFSKFFCGDTRTLHILVTGNHFYTGFSEAAYSAFIGNHFDYEFPLGIGWYNLFENNFSINLNVGAATSVFGEGCVISGNRSSGPFHVLRITDKTKITNNDMPSHMVEFINNPALESVSVLSNRIAGIRIQNAIQQMQFFEIVIADNKMTHDISLTDPNQVHLFVGQYVVISNNQCAGIDLGYTNGQVLSIVGNQCLEAKGLGLGNIQTRVIKSSIIANNTMMYTANDFNIGILRLGSFESGVSASPCTEIIVSGNRAVGRATDNSTGSAFVTHTGIQFSDQTASVDVMPSFLADIENSVVTGNIFNNGMIVTVWNGSSLGLSSLMTITGNILGGDESSGVGPAVSGNASSDINASKSVFADNVVIPHDTDLMGFVFAGEVLRVKGNLLFGRCSHIGNDGSFSFNVLQDHGNGAWSQGDNCGIGVVGNQNDASHNKFVHNLANQPALFVAGLRNNISHNMIKEGQLVSQGSGAVITGNVITSGDDLIVSSGGYYTLNGNNTGPFNAGGEIVVPDNESGTVIGNAAKAIRHASATQLNNNHMIVLGNRVASGETVFGTAPGFDSVGASADNALEDFNVTE